jgi:hypothetical protein
LEAPEADGTATGTALATDFKKGCPCEKFPYSLGLTSVLENLARCISEAVRQT